MKNFKLIKCRLTSVGNLFFCLNNNILVKISFNKPRAQAVIARNKNIEKWLEDYKSGKCRKFPYKLDLKGTHFQKNVWKAMLAIPFGKTKPYKWIAEKIGRPKAVRAVGNACGKNPFPVVIPCHRVIASNSIGGFSSGIHIKKKLLHLESSR